MSSLFLWVINPALVVDLLTFIQKVGAFIPQT